MSYSYNLKDADLVDGTPITITVIGDMDSENALSMFEQLVAGASGLLHIYFSYQ